MQYVSDVMDQTMDILRAQAQHARFSTSEFMNLAQGVYAALYLLHYPPVPTTVELEPVGTVEASPVPPPISGNGIARDAVTCLECGEQFTVLSGRHLDLHGLDARSYKKKHGMKLGTKLISGKASAKRRRAAKARGASSGLMAYHAERRQLRTLDITNANVA